MKIFCSGGNGFLGTHVVNKFLNCFNFEIITCSSKECDLRLIENCEKMVKDKDVVLHLAGNVGGIGYNNKYPYTLFYDNVTMGINLIEASRRAGVKKFVQIGTVCSYPKNTSIPFKEEDLWNGMPEITNLPYGEAKKILLIQLQALRRQYGFNAIYLLPVNLYGPGDNFDPESSHVIPALIKKFVEAKKENKESVSVWGTGNATREFLYVEDCAEAIVQATLKYDKGDPINIGAGFEISIKELAEKIKRIVGFEGEIIFNASKPDGQPRRSLDTKKAEREFGFKAKTDFDTGLKKTIEWYIEQL